MVNKDLQYSSLFVINKRHAESKTKYNATDTHTFLLIYYN